MRGIESDILGYYFVAGIGGIAFGVVLIALLIKMLKKKK